MRNLLHSYGSTEIHAGKIFRRQSRSYAESGFRRSSRRSSWRERRQKRREDREYEQGEKQSSLGERSFQTHRTLSGASGHERFDRKDEKLECLHRLVRDLELEAKGKRRRRDREELAKGSANVRGGYGETSHQSSSHRHQDRSREYAN